MLLKGSIYQENGTNFSIHEPNNRTPKYDTYMVTAGKVIDKYKVIIGDFMSPLSIINRFSR